MCVLVLFSWASIGKVSSLFYFPFAFSCLSVSVGFPLPFSWAAIKCGISVFPSACLPLALPFGLLLHVAFLFSILFAFLWASIKYESYSLFPLIKLLGFHCQCHFVSLSVCFLLAFHSTVILFSLLVCLSFELPLEASTSSFASLLVLRCHLCASFLYLSMWFG